MSASFPLTHPPASAPDVSNVNHPVRSAKLAKAVTPAQASIQRKPTKKTRNRIPPIQRSRVMEKYALGRNQTSIASEEKINRESVGRIVKSAEMEAFTEEIRERWRGLCDAAVESVRRLIAKDDRQTVLRVLESNGVIPPEGTTLNHIQTAPKPTGYERVKNLRAAFADVMLERAKAFKTPFPELAQIAEQHNIEVGLDLRGASDEAEEDES
jgi:hypothetical protein